MYPVHWRKCFYLRYLSNIWSNKLISFNILVLTISCVMLKYDQTFLKNLTVLVIYLIYFNGLTLFRAK